MSTIATLHINLLCNQYILVFQPDKVITKPKMIVFLYVLFFLPENVVLFSFHNSKLIYYTSLFCIKKMSHSHYQTSVLLHRYTHNILNENSSKMFACLFITISGFAYCFGSLIRHCFEGVGAIFDSGYFIKKELFYILFGSRWGLNPKMKALQTQPTVSPTLVHHIQRKDIKIVPNIQVYQYNLLRF